METIGCGTAIVTPFRADGSVDEPALWSLVNWQIESGIDFIVACGSTGEAATLDEEEWLRAVRLVIDAAAGRVPVWAGCTHNSTRVLVRLAGHLRRIPGVAAVLSANPYYNKPTQEGQFQHFLALAREVDPLPVCVYNVPGRTAANLEPETVAQLAAAAKNIEAIKEASGKLPQFAELAHIMPRGFKIFSGDDNLALAAIAVGAHGLISVASNEAPAEVARMIRAALEQQLGRGARAGAAFFAALRGQLLGVESGAREDRPEPDGKVRRSSAAAAGAAHRGHARQAGAAGRRAGPAEARADSGGRALRSVLKETMRRSLAVTSRHRPACTLPVIAFVLAAMPGSVIAQSPSSAAQAQTNGAQPPTQIQDQTGIWKVKPDISGKRNGVFPEPEAMDFADSRGLHFAL